MPELKTLRRADLLTICGHCATCVPEVKTLRRADLLILRAHLEGLQRGIRLEEVQQVPPDVLHPEVSVQELRGPASDALRRAGFSPSGSIRDRCCLLQTTHLCEQFTVV